MSELLAHLATMDLPRHLLTLCIGATAISVLTIAVTLVFRRAAAPIRARVLLAGTALLLLVPLLPHLQVGAQWSLVVLPSRTSSEQMESFGSEKALNDKTELSATRVVPEPERIIPEAKTSNSLQEHSAMPCNISVVASQNADTTSAQLQRTVPSSPAPQARDDGSSSTTAVPPVSALSPALSEASAHAEASLDTASPATSGLFTAEALCSVLAAVWGIGIIVGGVSLLAAAVSLCRLKTGLKPFRNPDAARSLTRAARKVGIKTPALWTSSDTPVPLAMGFGRDGVVLPSDLATILDRDELDAVMLHELGHLANHDHWVALLQRLACILFWWHPVVRWQNRLLAEAREEVCDNFVLNAQPDGRRYARFLVDLAERACLFRHMTLAAALLPDSGKLEGRILGLLDKERPIMTRLNTGGLLFLSGFCLAAVVLLASARVVRAEDAPAATEETKEAPNGTAAGVTPKALLDEQQQAKALDELRKLPESEQIAVLKTVYAKGDKPGREMASQELIRIGSDAAMKALEQMAKARVEPKAKKAGTPAETVYRDRKGGKGASSEEQIAQILEQIDFHLKKLALQGDKKKSDALATELETLKAAAGGDYSQLPLSEEPELHVVSIYEGALPPGVANGQDVPGEASVSVTYDKSPVILFIDVYDPVDWTVKVGEGVKLQKVMLRGYRAQSVDGLPEGVELDKSTYDENRTVDILGTGASPLAPKDERKARSLTGMEISTYQGKYKPKPDEVFTVGPENKHWRSQHLLPRAKALLAKASGVPLVTDEPDPETEAILLRLDTSETQIETAQKLAASDDPESHAILLRWMEEQLSGPQGDGEGMWALSTCKQYPCPGMAALILRHYDESADKWAAKHYLKALDNLAQADLPDAAALLLERAKSHLLDEDVPMEERFMLLGALNHQAKGGNAEASALINKAAQSDNEYIKKAATRMAKALSANAGETK